MIMQTPSRPENSASLAKGILGSQMGGPNDIPYTMRDYLEAAAHPLSRDPERQQAGELLATLNRLSLNAPAPGAQDRITTSIPAIEQMAAGEMSRMPGHVDLVKEQVLRKGGACHNEHDTLFAYHHHAQAGLSDITPHLQALAQSVQLNGPGMRR